MIVKAKEWASGAISILFLAGIFVVPAYLSSTAENKASAEPVCTTQTIPYESERQDSYDYDIGYESIETYGQSGIKEVCKDSEGNTVSEEITEEPITEVTIVGTREEEPETEYYAEDNYTRSGAICNDGSYSSATGRGACSWHGGVAQWQY